MDWIPSCSSSAPTQTEQATPFRSKAEPPNPLPEVLPAGSCITSMGANYQLKHDARREGHGYRLSKNSYFWLSPNDGPILQESSWVFGAAEVDWSTVHLPAASSAPKDSATCVHIGFEFDSETCRDCGATAAQIYVARGGRLVPMRASSAATDDEPVAEPNVYGIPRPVICCSECRAPCGSERCAYCALRLDVKYADDAAVARRTADKPGQAEARAERAAWELRSTPRLGKWQRETEAKHPWECNDDV